MEHMFHKLLLIIAHEYIKCVLNLIQHKYRYIKLHLYKYETEGCYNQSVGIICMVCFRCVLFSLVDFLTKMFDT